MTRCSRQICMKSSPSGLMTHCLCSFQLRSENTQNNSQRIRFEFFLSRNVFRVHKIRSVCFSLGSESLTNTSAHTQHVYWANSVQRHFSFLCCTPFAWPRARGRETNDHLISQHKRKSSRSSPTSRSACSCHSLVLEREKRQTSISHGDGH